MKKQNYFMYSAGISLILWALLFLYRMFLWQDQYAVSRFAAQMEIVVNLIILIPTYQLFKKLDEESKKIFLLIFITNIGLAASDVLWYGSTYLGVNSFHGKFVPFIADLVPFYIWTTSLVIFLWKVLNKFVFQNKNWLKIFLGFAAVNFIVLSLFLSSIHVQYSSSASIMQIIIFISYLIIFDFAALSLIYTESFGLLLFLSGIIILISGDFLLISGDVSIYSTTSHSTDLRSNGELLFLLGVLLDLVGISMMVYQGDNDISKWFRSDTAIKSKLTFWCFSIGIASFLLFFVLAYIFAVINREMFLGLPLFIMLYSVVVIMLSLYMGKYFEVPFKQLVGNIKLLMLGDKNSEVNVNFSTEEFVFLQKFIMEAFKDKDEKEQAKLNELAAQREAEQLKFVNEQLESDNKAKLLEFERERAQGELEHVQTQIALKEEQLKNEMAVVAEQEKFKKIVGQMMHDITSPIVSINTIVSKQGSNIPENDRVTLRSAAERIEGISSRLLKQYENKVEDENEKIETLLVSLSLLQIMNEKKEEYLDSGVNFIVEIDDKARFCFIQHNAGVFKRMVSNLVNNAVDALKNLDSKAYSLDGTTSVDSSNNQSDALLHEKEVTIKLSVSAKSAIVMIGDNGPGMPQHIQDKFNEGQSVSEGKGDAGHGIGLTQVHDAIILGMGRFEIYASDMGTEIIMYFPLTPAPHWIATGIKLNQADTVLILDDDNSIHGAWDNKFADILAENSTLRVEHFYEGKKAIAYINELTPEEKQNTFLLTDYELLEQGMNGLDVVEQTNMIRAILVTSYATNPKIQERVTILGIKTLPKELVSGVEIKIEKKLEKGSKRVDMVWVEDQKWYVDGLVKDHYSHLKVDVYYDPVNFMENVIQYPLDTKIILDTYYEFGTEGKHYKQTGYDLAEDLHALGFTKLILVAGEDPKGRAPEYLQVVRKKDGADTENLDKI